MPSAIVTPSGHGLGQRKDSLDHRDLRFAADPAVVRSLPAISDLRGPLMPPILDQKSLGSCTANTGASAYDYERARQGLPFIDGSRLFLYYNERELEGTIASDAGAEIRDIGKALAQYGICSEAEWPYDEAKVTTRPFALSYDQALKNQVLQYQAVQQTPDQIMGCLAPQADGSPGFPIMIGFTVFQGFEQLPASGIVPLPGPRERPLGGHANLLVGYDATRAHYPDTLLLTKNSWGVGWGQQGYAWFPMSYLTNTQLASDFWMIQLVESDQPPPPPPPVPTGGITITSEKQATWMRLTAAVPDGLPVAGWSVSDPALLSITPAGDNQVWISPHGTSTGTAVVTATSAGRSTSVRVKVSRKYVNGMAIVA